MLLTWPTETILLTILLQLVHSRVYETSFQFNRFQKKDGWIFLDKMTFSKGMGHLQLETRTSGLSLGGLDNHTMLTLQAIPEAVWDIQERSKCNARYQGMTRTMIKVSPPSKENDNGDMTDKASMIMSVQSDTLYYFVLKDCSKSLRANYSNEQLTMFIRLTLTNNGKEVGAEQDHWYIIPIIISAGLWLVFYNKDGLSKGDTDWAKMMLFMGIATNISSLAWRTFGFLIYTWTGLDYLFFHIIYLFMHSISESFIIGLLLLIAFGWSINYAKGKDFDLILPIMMFMGGVNVVTTLLTKINNRQHDRHHIFDSVPGMILISYRTLILIPFIIGIVITYRSSRHKVKEFILKFAIFGFMYISSLPIIWLWANSNVIERNQNQFVFVAVQTVKTLCNIMLTYTISYKKSQYQSVAYRNNSFIPESQSGFR